MCEIIRNWPFVDRSTDFNHNALVTNTFPPSRVGLSLRLYGGTLIICVLVQRKKVESSFPFLFPLSFVLSVVPFLQFNLAGYSK